MSTDKRSDKSSLLIDDDWGQFKCVEFDIKEVAVFSTSKYEDETGE